MKHNTNVNKYLSNGKYNPYLSEIIRQKRKEELLTKDKNKRLDNRTVLQKIFAA